LPRSFKFEQSNQEVVDEHSFCTILCYATGLGFSRFVFDKITTSTVAYFRIFGLDKVSTTHIPLFRICFGVSVETKSTHTPLDSCAKRNSCVSYHQHIATKETIENDKKRWLPNRKVGLLVVCYKWT
jgi:hypothetical protein